MNAMQEYDFKVMSEIHPVPKLHSWMNFPIPFPRNDWRKFTDDVYLYDDKWIRILDLEEQIKKMINQIFQERPSLP